MKMLRRILILLAVLLLLPVPAQAADGNITVEYQVEGYGSVEGVTFRLYRVPDVIATMPNAYAYMLKHELDPIVSVQTDEQGRASFPNLEDGKYLLVSGACQVGDKFCIAEKSLLTIPGETVDGSTSGQITVYPKYELQEKEPIQYQVLVIWEDEGFEHQRPDRVTVYLYRNCQRQEPITITKEGNWRYFWIEEDPMVEWGVVQTDLVGYTIDYDELTRTFVIRNIITDDPADPSGPSDSTDPSDPTETTPTEPDGPKLPQTGQLWWPVPLMAIVGMVLVLLGWMRRKESLDEA